MKYWTLLTIIQLITASAAFAQSGKAAFDKHAFDLLKHQDQITSYDIVLLKERAELKRLDGIVGEETFVSGPVHAKVKEIITPKQKWNTAAFNSLFKEYQKGKTYEGCFCGPTFPLAIRLYVRHLDTNSFGENPQMRDTKVATVLFDDGYDSVVISDTANGQRYFRLSVGHSADAHVPHYIAKLCEGEELKYTYRKEISNQRTGDQKTLSLNLRHNENIDNHRPLDHWTVYLRSHLSVMHRQRAVCTRRFWRGTC